MAIDIAIVGTDVFEYNPSARRLTFFADILRRSGFKIACFGVYQLGKYGISKPVSGFIPSAFFINSRNRVLAAVINIFLAFPLVLIITMLKPRVVLLSIPKFEPLLFIYLPTRLAKSKIIIDFRDPEEEYMLYYHRKGLSSLLAKIIRKINYSIYRRADILIGATKTMTELLERGLGRRVLCIPNGADLRIFTPVDRTLARRRLGLPEDALILVYMGGIGRSGYYEVFKPLSIIKRMREETGTNLLYVLAGPVFDNKLIQELRKFKDVVRYVGILNIKGVVELLSASDIGIVPRVGDPVYDSAIPIKFYEYIAMGLPVIALARRESELAKIILERKLGIVCNPNDYSCLETALVSLTDKKLREYKNNVLEFRKYIDRNIYGKLLINIVKRLTKSEYR